MTAAVIAFTLWSFVADEHPVRPGTWAAYIAVLRADELQHGKTSWTQEQLREAREAVAAPATSAPPWPGWAHSFHVMLLDWFDLLLPAVVIVGAMLVLRCWWRNRLVAALFWSLIWFAVLLALHLVVRPGPGPAAVVRVEGAVLRQGNGLSYPPQVYQGLPVQLSAGAEAVVRTRRENGWVQLEFSTGIIGWVPQDAVYLVEEN